MKKFLVIMLIFLIGLIVYVNTNNNSNKLAAIIEEDEMSMKITITYEKDAPKYVVMDYIFLDDSMATQTHSWLDSLVEKYMKNGEKIIKVSSPEKNIVRIEGDASIEELQFPRGSKSEAKQEFEESGFRIL